LVEAATKAAGRSEPWEQRRALKDAARFAAERDRIAPDFIPRPRQGETVTVIPPTRFAPPVTGARAADVVVQRREVRLDDGWSFDVNEWRGPANIAETSGVTVPVNPPLVFNRNAFVLSGQSITAGEISAIDINGDGKADSLTAGPSMSASIQLTAQAVAEMQESVGRAMRAASEQMRTGNDMALALLGGVFGLARPGAVISPALTASDIANRIEQALAAAVERVGAAGAAVTVRDFPQDVSSSYVARILEARGISGSYDAADAAWEFRRSAVPPRADAAENMARQILTLVQRSGASQVDGIRLRGLDLGRMIGLLRGVGIVSAQDLLKDAWTFRWAQPPAPGQAENNMAAAILSALRDAAAGRSGGLAQVRVSEGALVGVDQREVFQILRLAGAIEEYDSTFGCWAISQFVPPVADPGANGVVGANRGLFASGAAGMATLSRPERQAVVTPLPPAQDPFPATPHKRRIRLAPGPAS
jgi:hypothetical protein